MALTRLPRPTPPDSPVDALPSYCLSELESFFPRPRVFAYAPTARTITATLTNRLTWEARAEILWSERRRSARAPPASPLPAPRSPSARPARRRPKYVACAATSPMSTKSNAYSAYNPTPKPPSAPSSKAISESSPRFTPPTRAYRLPTTERAATLSASLHFIALNAGDTTAVVKTMPPSHTPASTTCARWRSPLNALTTPNCYRSSVIICSAGPLLLLAADSPSTTRLFALSVARTEGLLGDGDQRGLGSRKVGRGGAEGGVEVPGHQRNHHERGSEDGQFQGSVVAERFGREDQAGYEDYGERDTAVEASRLGVGPRVNGTHDLPPLVGVRALGLGRAVVADLGPAPVANQPPLVIYLAPDEDLVLRGDPGIVRVGVGEPGGAVALRASVRV